MSKKLWLLIGLLFLTLVLTLKICSDGGLLGPEEISSKPMVYNPQDVEVINRLLRGDGSGRDPQYFSSRLNELGWQPGQPQTWKGDNQSGVHIIWTQSGSIEALMLNNAYLIGSVDLTGLSAVSILYLSGNMIKEVKGLEGLKALKRLTLDKNMLSGPIDFTGLKELEVINLSCNNLKEVKGLEGLLKLKTIDLSQNQLTEVGDLGKLTNLEFLALNNNHLTHIGLLDNLKSLHTLLIQGGNKIKDIGTLSQAANMYRLNISDNELSHVGPLGYLPNLVELSINTPTLTETFDLTKMPRLFRLEVAGYQAASPEFLKTAGPTLAVLSYSARQIPRLNLADYNWPILQWLRIQTDESLEYVDFNGKAIKTVLVSGLLTPDQIKNPGAIETLYLYSDSLHMISDIRALKAALKPARLTVAPQSPPLSDGQAEVKAGEVYGLESLSPTLVKELQDAGPEAELVFYEADPSGENQNNCSMLNAPNEKVDVGNHDGQITVTFLQPGRFKAAIKVNDPSLFQTDNPRYRRNNIFAVYDHIFEASGLALGSYSFNAADVEVINNILRHNDSGDLAKRRGWQIDQPQTWQDRAQKQHSASGSKEREILGWKNGYLESIDFRFMSLTGELDLTGLTRLESIIIDNNKITSIKGLSTLSRLQSLHASSSGLSGPLDLSGLKNLDQAWLGYNQITEIKGLETLNSLSTLNLSRNQLTRLEGLDGLASLDFLVLRQNQLTDIGDLSRLTEVWTLDVAQNKLTSLGDLSQLKGLSSLNFGGNPLTDFSFLQKLPSKITSLGFSGEEAHLVNLSGLEEIELYDWADQVIDLKNRPLRKLTLHSHVPLEKIINPGPIQSLNINGEAGYSLAELMAMRAVLNPSDERFFTQNYRLDDVAANIAAGQAYKIEELSPSLAAEIKTGGEIVAIEARFCQDITTPFDEQWGRDLNKFGGSCQYRVEVLAKAPQDDKSEFLRFRGYLVWDREGGLITFPRSGIYRLGLKRKAFSFSRGLSVEYLDDFVVTEK